MYKVLVQVCAILGIICDLQKTKPLSKQLTHLPKVTLECQCLDARIVKPMYPRRLVITTCQLPAPPQHMFHACHFHTSVKVSYLSMYKYNIVSSLAAHWFNTMWSYDGIMLCDPVTITATFCNP